MNELELSNDSDEELYKQSVEKQFRPKTRRIRARNYRDAKVIQSAKKTNKSRAKEKAARKARKINRNKSN